jgi:protein TonB
MSTNGAYVVSVAVHASLAAALGVLPLLSEERLPEQTTAVIDSVPLFVPLPPPPPGQTDLGRRNVVPRVDSGPRRIVPTPDNVSPDDVAVRVGMATDEIDDPAGGGDGPGTPDGTIGSVLVDDSTAPPPAPAVVRITSGLTAPRVVRRIEPAYPALALAAHATATVLLEAEVDPLGNVTRVSVLHGHPLFDAAAVEAVERWRYQPLLLNGVPTAFILTVTVRFGLRR